MNVVPIEDGYFTIPQDESELPQLLGSRCRSCGEVFFPRRETCARCLSYDTHELRLSSRGTLYAWTFIRVAGFGDQRTDQPGYAAGQVDLPEGPRVQAVLEGGPESFRIGMALEMALAPVGQDKDGRSIVSFRFRPASSAT